jgi:hypothetical protein
LANNHEFWSFFRSGVQTNTIVATMITPFRILPYDPLVNDTFVLSECLVWLAEGE